MSSSHPPALQRSVERCLVTECSLSDGVGLTLGVSGGPDSMALLDVLAKLRSRVGHQLVAVAVDHGLRPQAAAEVELVASLCSHHDVPLVVERLHLQDGPNLQERARRARYEVLERVSQAHFDAAGLIVTAHHRQDRAETVLLRLLRGTSLAGLGVLPVREGTRLRPMIRADRSSVLKHVERHGLRVAHDPSNHDPRFLRVRVRQELLPVLTELGPGIVDALNEVADEALALESPLGLNREQRRQLRRAFAQAGRLDLPLGRGLRLIRD